MQLSQALKEISKSYVSGTVEFYSNMKDNPWQRAHDKLEGQLVIHQNDPDYFNKIKSPVATFLKECRDLISLYVSCNPEQPNLPSLCDSFVIGNEEKVKQMQAMARNVCSVCESSESVRVIAHPTLGAGIYCTEHSK